MDPRNEQDLIIIQALGDSMGLEIELGLKATAPTVDREQGGTQVMLVAQESSEMFKHNQGVLFLATCNQKDQDHVVQVLHEFIVSSVQVGHFGDESCRDQWPNNLLVDLIRVPW